MDRLRAGATPILRVDTPQHVVVDQVVYVLPLVHRERAVRRAHHARTHAGRLLHIGEPGVDFCTQRVTLHFRHIRMRVAVARDFMAFGDHALLQRRVPHRILADVEERRFDALLLENVENRGGVLVARAVIKGQRNDLMAFRTRRYADNLCIHHLFGHPFGDALLGHVAHPDFTLAVLTAGFDHLDDTAGDIDRNTMRNRLIVGRMAFGHVTAGRDTDLRVPGKPRITPIRRVNLLIVNRQRHRVPSRRFQHTAVHCEQFARMRAEIIMGAEQLFRRCTSRNLHLLTVDEHDNMTQPRLPRPRAPAHDQKHNHHQCRNKPPQPRLTLTLARTGSAITERKLFYFLH